MRDSTRQQIWPVWKNGPGTFWRTRVQRTWHDYQWLIIGALWLIALSLGYVGFAKHLAAEGKTGSFWDILYLALQLIPLQSGSVPNPSWELVAARLLAPGVAAYTAVQTLFVVFSAQLQWFRVRFTRDHVIICGLGRKGLLLAQGFQQRGYPVVVIERDEDNDLLEQCRNHNVIILIGDATNPAILCQAQVRRARYLVAVCGDDGTNAEIAVNARDLVASQRGRVLSCFVHIIEPELCSLLRGQEIPARRVESFRLEFFNVFASGARILLREYPPYSETAQGETCPPHILVVGLGRLGESLVEQAARGWRARHKATGQRLPITIVDRDAARKVESLCLRYPRLAEACQVLPRQMDTRDAEFQKAVFLFDERKQCQVTAAYVCFDNDSLGLSAGLSILQKIRGSRVPVVVRMRHDTGLASLVEKMDDGSFANLHAFGLLDRTCTPDIILGGTHEVVARAIHDEWVRNQESRGKTPATEPLMVAWEKLPEHIRESNCQQAGHIGMKLTAIGCCIGPLTDWDAEDFQFTADEVERMAEMEHERWVEERRAAGWTPGPRDSQAKTTPYLVPWAELPEDIKDYDRDFVRGMPRFLAGVGLQIYRLPPTRPDS